MSLGLVSKARKEKQMASLKAGIENRESTKNLWINSVKSRICKCGMETTGIFKDGKNRCPKCGEVI